MRRGMNMVVAPVVWRGIMIQRLEGSVSGHGRKIIDHSVDILELSVGVTRRLGNKCVVRARNSISGVKGRRKSKERKKGLPTRRRFAKHGTATEQSMGVLRLGMAPVDGDTDTGGKVRLNEDGPDVHGKKECPVI